MEPAMAFSRHRDIKRVVVPNQQFRHARGDLLPVRMHGDFALDCISCFLVPRRDPDSVANREL